MFPFVLAFMQVDYKFEPLESKQIDARVWAVNDKHVNMFVVKNGSEFLVVDAGVNAINIGNELRKLKIDTTLVTTVLLTHTHRDHIAAIKLFPNAQIYVSAFEKFSPENSETIQLTTDTTFKINKLKIKMIATPGHTPGSVSYCIADKYLFVGDAFSLRSGVVARPNEKYTRDMPSAVKSFDKIKSLKNLKYLFTAHTGCSAHCKVALQVNL